MGIRRRVKVDSRTIINISFEPVTKISASLGEETLLVSGGQLVLHYPLILLALLMLTDHLFPAPALAGIPPYVKIELRYTPLINQS